MPKIKLTKNELKLQRDAMKRYQRYLPTLQLKKQQLQAEVRHVREEIARLQEQESELESRSRRMLALFAGEEASPLAELLAVREWQVGLRNVAGLDVPVFAGVSFQEAEFDLFAAPLWYEDALALLAELLELRLRVLLAEEQQERLEHELRVVTQRVNLFEKVKIPEARENIRRINIYIGDQQTNSVGRSKIAKGKCAVRDAALA